MIIQFSSSIEVTSCTAPDDLIFLK